MTPEEYIKAYTRGNSNELVGGGYHEWLTPENALAAVELAREEMKVPASEDLEKAADRYADCTANLDARETRFRGFIAGAKWLKDKMMKDVVKN